MGTGVASVMLVVLSVAAYEFTRRLPTSFVVGGDTTAATFTALEQTESQSQSGMFASPENPVDLIIHCSKLRRVDSSRSELPCSDGSIELEHVFIEALRLGQNTRVDLLVADKNLELTLTASSGDNSLVTLLFSHTKVLAAKPSSRAFEGEWTIESSDAPIRLIFVHPRFHSGDDEGGQHLSPGTAFAFQHEGRSGFINNTGTFSIADIESDVRKPLNDDLIQVYSLKSGMVRTMSTVYASDNSLIGLHLELLGKSDDIQTRSPLSDNAINHATNTAERITGIHITRAWLFTTLWTPFLIALFIAIFSNHHNKHLNNATHTIATNTK